MARAIAAVIVGYLAIAVWVIGVTLIAYLILGASFAFREGTTEVTLGWVAVDLLSGLTGAIIGGFVTAAMARSPNNTPVKVLAGVVLVLGLLTAAAQLMAGGAAVTETPAAELSAFEAFSQTKQPIWHSFTLPLVGLVGVLIGGNLRRRGRAESVTQGNDG